MFHYYALLGLMVAFALADRLADLGPTPRYATFVGAVAVAFINYHLAGVAFTAAWVAWRSTWGVVPGSSTGPIGVRDVGATLAGHAILAPALALAAALCGRSIGQALSVGLAWALLATALCWWAGIRAGKAKEAGVAEGYSSPALAQLARGAAFGAAFLVVAV